MGKISGNTSERETETTRMLVYGTWALVLVSVVSMVTTCSKMASQVEEVKKATELRWRPFLLSDEVNHQFLQAYFVGETETDLTNYLEIDSTKIGSAEWFGVKYFGFVNPRTVRMKNIGSSPLRVSARAFSSITERQWVEDYSKKPELLVKGILPELKPPEVDRVLIPDDSISLDSVGVIRKIPKKEFEGLLEDGSIVIYPFTFIEYKDVYNHVYNVLYMSYFRLTFQVVDSVVIFSDSVVGGLEVYRWDLKLE